MYGQTRVAAYLLRRGARTDIHNRKGRTPLIVALHYGRTGVARLLILKGADVNLKSTSTGYAPLHLVAQKGYLSLAKLLLRKGAKVNVKDNRYRTPLKYAVNNSHHKVADLLRKHGGQM